MTQGVLVSVSVSVLAVAYTRILVLDRIGACLYRPFSINKGVNNILARLRCYVNYLLMAYEKISLQ